MPKAPGAAAGGDAELQKDVKAQLASLGFGSGGGFSDGAFDDFAPEKAKKRIGGGQQKDQAGQQQQRRQGAGGRGDGKAGGRGAGRADGRGGRGRGQGQQRDGDRGGRGQGQQRDGDRGGRGQGQQRDGDRGGRGQGQQRWQQGGGGGAAGQQQQRRSWGGGEDEAPPAPRIPNAKSILPKDEPTIWHEAASTLPALAAPTEEAAPELVAPKRKQAERLLLVEEQAFEQNMGRRSSADAKWLQQVRRSGTTADKVAAMSVLLQDGAVANLPSLDGLLAMVCKKGGARAVVGSAMDALKELFTTVLLPDRKLRFFEQQPLDKVEPGREGERRLLYWLVEDGIKKRYATYVDALEACSRDNLEYVKDRAVKALFELLSAKPEQEARLLGALVNKLGDPDRKLASKVGYLLTRLLAEHPGMSVPVVREVERFMFRPGLQDRARYYAVVYLNQMVLNHRQPAQTAGASLPRRLIDVYFTVFKMVLDGKIGTAAQLAKAQADKAAEAAAKRKKGEAAKARAAEEARQKAAAAAAATNQQGSGEMDGRMLSALITGVRRAFPYVPADEVEPLIEAHADALFRLVHARSFGVATQALLLLFQLMSSRSTGSDRFYRALYAVLGSPELYRSTKAPMFLSLLFKAIKADVSAKRTAAFAKRLLQVAQEAPGHFACGCLLLTSELLKARPALWGAVLQPEESEADGLERFQDAPEDGPAAAAAQQQEGGSGGARRAARRAAAGSGKGSKQAAGGSDEEGNSDEEGGEDLNGLAGSGSSSEEEEGGAEDSEGEPDLMPGLRQQQAAAAAAAAQRAAEEAAAAADAQRWPASKEAYDLHKREPQFSNADRSCLWELTSLATHVHPSVAAMARTLLAGQNVLYDGDPLRDLTLGAFLEKFVQKKAKAIAKGDSAMQPLALRPAAAAAAVGPQQWAALAGAQADALAALAEKDVRPDDMFFHKYYSLQAVQDKAKARRKKKGEGEDELLSDAESEDSDAADDFLAHQEEGGDDGIGADPDRSGMDYDYADLAAAMDSGDDSDAAASDSDVDGSEEEEEEAGGSGRFGAKFAAAGDEDGSGGSEGSGSGFDSEEEDGEEPAGATFSDMSDSEGSGSEGEEEGLSGGSGSEDDDSSDGGFEAELAADDLSEDDEDGSSGSEEDDVAADAEVAALIRKHQIRPLAAAAGQAGSDEDLNPFELAEASSSDEEAAAAAAAAPKAGGKRGRQQQQEQQRQEQREARRAAKAAAEAATAGGRQKRKKSHDPMGIFASADDYAEMIEKDLAEGGGRDDGEEPAGGRSSAGGKQRRQQRPRQQPGGGGGRDGGRLSKRQQQAGGGGGRPFKQAKRQR